jgi:hypothetical protein
LHLRPAPAWNGTQDFSVVRTPELSRQLVLDAKLQTSDGSTQSVLPEFEMHLPDIQQLENYYKK